MKGDMDMKEKNRAEEWFRAKHDEADADAHWADAAWWDERARTMWDEVDDIPDNGLYWTSVED